MGSGNMGILTNRAAVTMVLLGIGSGAIGCLGTSQSTSSSNESKSSTTSATFSSIQSAILSPKCGTCHVSQRLGGVDLSTYAAVLNYTKPGEPDSSSLYTQVKSGAMPQGGPALSQTDQQKISDWIKAGAKND